MRYIVNVAWGFVIFLAVIILLFCLTAVIIGGMPVQPWR